MINILGSCLLVAALSWVFASRSFGTPPHPEGGDGNGILVRLELPWTTLTRGEKIQYEYILNNVSDRPIPVAFPSAERKFGWPNGGQPYLEGKYIILGQEPAELNIHNSNWPPTGLDNVGIEAWGELAAGSRVKWNRNRLRSVLFGLGADDSLQAIQAHWLIGPKRWVSSEPVPVKVVSSISGRKKVFDAEWSSYGWGKNHCSGTAYTIPIEERLFLFWKALRVSEVDPEDRFGHKIDKDGTNMEITITGPSGPRKVYVHLRHGLTRETPWPVGPVKLFYPKPEPIPPAELEVLRKEILSAGESRPTGERPDKHSGNKGPSGSSPANVPDDGKGAWLWVVVAMVVFMAIVLFVILWKHRKRTWPRE